MNSIIEMIKILLPILLGSLITLVCSIILHKYQFSVEIRKEYLKYEKGKD
jgi:hypothetical protein